MPLIADITTTTYSGRNYIDALLDNGPGWNWLTPFRNTIYYSFSVASDNEVGNSDISGGVTSFNAGQQSACRSLLAYISQLTGITFSAATEHIDADLRFANTNIVSSASTSGLCSWKYKYSTDGDGIVTSYSASAYVYLDNVEWSQQNGNSPGGELNQGITAGTPGYQALLHEMGHALGLKHPFEGDIRLPSAEDNTANSVMSYSDSGGTYSTFSPYDIAALNWLFGGDGVGGAIGVGSAGKYITGSGVNDSIAGLAGNDFLEGAGGNDSIDGGAGADVAVFNGALSNYTLTKTGGTYTVRDKTGADGTDTTSNIEKLEFTDKTVNLMVQAIAAAAPQADVQRLEELYVAFFNRVPDADGLAYWIGQMSAGQGVNQIAESFYNAGVQYSSLTGFSTTMSNADFVKVVYKNVLGRSGANAPPDADVAYWANQIATGADTRGSLINTMLGSAHTFKGNATWGWVADLLDNKIAVANTFAIEWGLNYATPSDSISQGMAIAAAVTPTSTAAAIALIGVSGTEIHVA